MVASESNSSTADREIALSREINAPLNVVYRVWTELEHLERWWGPDGFTTTSQGFDFRIGGSWDYVMHGPDGTDYPNRITFTEIVAEKRLAYDHGDGASVHFQTVTTFEDLGGRTRVTMTSLFPTREALAYVVENFHAIEGGQQHLGNLAAYAESM